MNKKRILFVKLWELEVDCTNRGIRSIRLKFQMSIVNIKPIVQLFRCSGTCEIQVRTKICQFIRM